MIDINDITVRIGSKVLLDHASAHIADGWKVGLVGAEGVIDKKRLVTDPDEAARFVAETKLDALAVAVGTSHGAYKFTRKPDGEILAIDVIEKIHKKLPNTHMVMHGSSSVPQELQDLINAYGGAIPQTYGVPVEEIVRGIKSGVRKVNVDTDCRMAITGAIRKLFAFLQLPV